MTSTMDDILKAGRAKNRRLRWLPEPEPQQRRYLFVSVDDHLVEPRNTFVDRVPAGMKDAAPRIVESDDGEQAWLVEGQTRPFTGSDAVVGWEPESVDDWRLPMHYEEMRSGCYDADARVHDMDLAGIYASLAFPSSIWGFCGQRIWGQGDRELAQACVRAYNDWTAEEWVAGHEGRLIPNAIVYMPDPEVAAAEVRRNASRGFHSVTLSENPERLGLPSIHTPFWDPLLAACAETGTVINLHLGSSSSRPPTSSDSPLWVSSMLWPAQTMCAAAEWVYSQACLRFPQLRVVFSEGGIGWVPVLLERMARSHTRRGYMHHWQSSTVSPMDVLLGNFWYCAIEEPLSMEHRHHIGIEHILMESDYPHSDTSWPDSQNVLDEQVKLMSPDEISRVTHENAAGLYGLDLTGGSPWLQAS